MAACDVAVVVALPPLMNDEIAAARAAVKFGSAVMAAVAALTESANVVTCWVLLYCGGGGIAWCARSCRDSI